MMSFVYCFHSKRTENLKQCLRMLFERESCIHEVILVCNDKTEEKFEGCSLYNMNLSNYEKNKMCNFGVSKASSEKIALLDSDRVLPRGYFSEVEKRIGHGLFFSCKNMIQLIRPHSDDEIESGVLQGNMEERCEGWEPRRKNLFSGNTVFTKQDFFNVGGMDENFVGYGFADNDMTYNVMSKGMKAIWMGGLEIHLHHEKETMEGNKMVGFEKYRKTSQKNFNKFIGKWRLEEYAKKIY